MKKKIYSIMLSGALGVSLLSGCSQMTIPGMNPTGNNESQTEQDVASSDQGNNSSENDETEEGKDANSLLDENDTEEEDVAEDDSEDESDSDADDISEEDDENSTESSVSQGDSFLYKYSIEKCGEFADKEWDLQFNSNVPYFLNDDKETGDVIGITGEIVSKNAKAFKNLGNGYYAIAKGDDVNCWGLYDAEGTEIIPCEAAMIDYPSENRDIGQDRFLILIYTTEETKNENEAIFYTTDNYFSLSPQEGDTMYKGYRKIYDLEEQKFVGDIEESEADKYGIIPCGDSIVINTDKASVLYDADGKELYKTDEFIDVGDGFIVVGSKRVIDSEGNDVYYSNESLNVISGSYKYLNAYNDGKHVAIDMNGNQVLEGSYDGIYSEKDGIFRVESGEKEELILSDGTPVLSGYDGYSHEIIPGYYDVDDDVYAFNEKLTGYDDSTPYQLIFRNGNDLHVLNEGMDDVTLDAADDYFYALDIGLVEYKNSKNLYGVCDAFTGEEILECEYHDVRYDSEQKYLYAKKDSTWEVYKLNLDRMD